MRARLAVVLLMLPALAWAGGTFDVPCGSSRQSVVSVGLTSTSTPAGTANSTTDAGARINSLGQLASRRLVTYCVSKVPSNNAAVLVSLHADGTPVLVAPQVDAGLEPDGGAYPADTGLILGWGDCVSFPLADNVVPKAAATIAATQVNVFECAGSP